MSRVGNKQKQNNRVVKDKEQVSLKLMADTFLGAYSKLGVPRDELAKQKTKQADEEMLRQRVRGRAQENSGFGRQCFDR